MDVVQCQIIGAIKDVMHKYNDKHPLKTRSTKGVWKVMKIDMTKAIGSIKGKELEKLLAVENPANGEEFFAEVSFLYIHTSTNLSLVSSLMLDQLMCMM